MIEHTSFTMYLDSFKSMPLIIATVLSAWIARGRLYVSLVAMLVLVMTVFKYWAAQMKMSSSVLCADKVRLNIIQITT